MDEGELQRLALFDGEAVMILAPCRPIIQQTSNGDDKYIMGEVDN